MSVFDVDRPTQLNEMILRGNQNGLYVNDANVTSVNGLFLHNTKAGVFARQGARLRVYHGTFVGNGFSNPGDASGAVVLGPGGFQDVRNNVMVGNQYGVQCTGCGSNPGHNLVWGNIEDYAGEAGRGNADVSADPRFVDPGAGDYRLRAGSPAIDVGVQVGAAHDAGGVARPAGAGPDLGAYEWQPPSADVVINEVAANGAPADWIELLNNSDETVDLAEATLWQQVFFEDESCGQCAPCRIGARLVRQALDRYLESGDPSSLRHLDELHWEMDQGSICGLGMVAALPAVTAMKHFPHHFGLRS